MLKIPPVFLSILAASVRMPAGQGLAGKGRPRKRYFLALLAKFCGRTPNTRIAGRPVGIPIGVTCFRAAFSPS